MKPAARAELYIHGQIAIGEEMIPNLRRFDEKLMLSGLAAHFLLLFLQFVSSLEIAMMSAPGLGNSIRTHEAGSSTGEEFMGEMCLVLLLWLIWDILDLGCEFVRYRSCLQKTNQHTVS